MWPARGQWIKLNRAKLAMLLEQLTGSSLQDYIGVLAAIGLCDLPESVAVLVA
jgi:hypothetical protein